MSHVIRGWRNDGLAKVTGRAKFTDDLKMDRMLHATPVYSPFVHAKIEKIEIDAALSSPGVKTILTAKDIPGSQRFGQIERDYSLLVSDTVRYHGDVVAVVVASTHALAKGAGERVKVHGTELAPILDPEKALQPGSPLVHNDKGTNLACHHKVRLGDPKAGFEESDIIIEERFTTPFIEHAYLETESCLCWPRSDGVVEIVGSMQHPFSTRRFVAAFLGKPLADIEVKTVPVGGGFGGKDDTAAAVCARTALAALVTGVPVKTTYEREWSIRESYKRHPYVMYYKMGFNRAGEIKAAKVKIVADSGAYCSVTPWVTWRSTVQCCGPYEVENVHCDTYGAYTNNVFTGAMRGFGSPQVNFAIEQIMDLAAQRLKLCPVEIRTRNAVKQGSKTITGQALTRHTVSAIEVLNKVDQASDFRAKYKTCSKGKGDRLYGIGLAMGYRGMSLGAEGRDFNSAIVNVQFDGSVIVEVAIHENGQGAETAMVVLLAQQLGISKERIRYRMSSTSTIPDGGNTVSSRGTLMGGSALIDAAKMVKRKMAEVTSPVLGCAPEQILFQNDQLRNAADGGRSISFDDAVRQMFEAQEYPYGFGTFKSPRVTWDESTGKGDAYFTWVYGAQVAEVEIEKLSGKITLVGAYAAHDVGKAIHPPSLLGQFYGGMAMGAGFGLFEQLVCDQGVISSLNYDRYRIPRAKDLPDFRAIIVENPDPLSLSGAKGIGEPANELMAAAIANAVANATGRRHTRLPVQPRVTDETPRQS